MIAWPHIDIGSKQILYKYQLDVEIYPDFFPDKLGLFTARYYWFEIKCQRGIVSGPANSGGACARSRLAATHGKTTEFWIAKLA